jgi:hypothetical protein
MLIVLLPWVVTAAIFPSGRLSRKGFADLTSVSVGNTFLFY